MPVLPLKAPGGGVYSRERGGMRQEGDRRPLLSRLSRLPERTATLCHEECPPDPGSPLERGREICRRSPERLQVPLSQAAGAAA